jgi:hypothetical protein
MRFLISGSVQEITSARRMSETLNRDIVHMVEKAAFLRDITF